MQGALSSAVKSVQDREHHATKTDQTDTETEMRKAQPDMEAEESREIERLDPERKGERSITN